MNFVKHFGRLSVLFGTALCLNSSSLALDVTVNSEGGADATTINEALALITADTDPTMNTITITGGGPYEEGIVIGVPLTIIGADPVDRPVIVITLNDGSVEGRENDGIINSAPVDIVFENLIFIPSLFDWPGDDGFDFRPFSDADDFDITVRNCVITANAGDDTPITLTGDTLETEILTSAGGSFQDDGFQVLATFSGIPSGNIDVLIEDTVVSHVDFDGERGSAGQDSFILGGENTSVIFRNTTVSFGDRWGMQLLSNVTVDIQGTAEEPVTVRGMGSSGILCFSGNHDWDYIQLIENPLGCRIDADTNLSHSISNALVYGNTELGIGYFFAPAEGEEKTFTIDNTTVYNSVELVALRSSSAQANFTVDISDSVFAGTPDDTFLVTELFPDDPQTYANVNIADSAISVFFGDRLETITETNVITDDPMFVSTDPTAEGFLVVTSPAYATAGSGASALGGYFSYGGETNVTEWMMY